MDSNSTYQYYRPRRRISIFFPLLLITAGVVLLLTNMKLVDWDVWDAIFMCWPVLFIAGGLDGLVQGENPVWQVFWIGFGALMLAGNLGYLAWNSWDIVLRLWPLLLIAAGLSVLAGRSSIGNLVSAVLVVALLGGALLLLSQTPMPASTMAGDRISQSLDGAQKSDVYLNLPAGKLRVSAMSESAGQIEGTLRQPDAGNIDRSFYVDQDTAHLSLRGTGVSVWIPFGPNRHQNEWDLRFNPSVPLALNADMGAGETDVDLTGMTIDRARVNIGAGSTTVRLPAEGRFEAQIDGGVGSVTILLPRAMAVRVQAHTALVDLDLPADFVQDGDNYRSPNITGADSIVDLNLNLAIGRVAIKYVDIGE